jgi:hypothetical protein
VGFQETQIFYNNQVIIIIIVYHIHFFPNTMENEVAEEAIICEGSKKLLKVANKSDRPPA